MVLSGAPPVRWRSAEAQKVVQGSQILKKIKRDQKLPFHFLTFLRNRIYESF
jgi:hypothetical protein